MEQMDKKTRLLAALQGKPTDRPPVSFWRHFGGEDAHGLQCVKKHVEFFHETDLDFIKVMHDGMTAPCSLEVHDLDDLKKFRPRGRKNPYIIEYVERAKRITEEIGDQVYTYTNVFAPFTLLRRIGDEKLRYYIWQDESTVCSAMDALSEDLALLCEMLIKEAGCLGVFAAFQGNEVSRFTPGQFKHLVEPYDQKMLQAANEASPYNILHFCAWDEIKNRMDIWKEYPGCAVNWAIYVDDITLPQGRELFHKRAVMGGFDNRKGKILYHGTEKEVKDETKRLVEEYRMQTGSTDGLIIGADCSFLTDFELQRFGWVTEALNEIAENN